MGRVVVTGGAGFIGSHLVELLCAQGWSVCVIDDLSAGSLDNLAGVAGQVDLVQGSILDDSSLDRAMKQADAVVHLAATVSVPGSVADPISCCDLNVTGTVKVLAKCRELGIRRFVQASTSAVYGRLPGLPKTEESPALPVTPYAASKLSAEQFAAAFAEMEGLSAASLRFFNVYGPRQSLASAYTGVVAIIMERLAQGRAMEVYGDGLQTRDFVSVADVARAVSLCLERQAAGHRVFNVASGRSASLLDVIHILEERVGRRLERGHGPERVGDIRHSAASIDRIQQEIGWRPVVALEDGLMETYRHGQG